MYTLSRALTLSFAAMLSCMLASCGKDANGRPEVVIYSSVDQIFAEPVLRQFEARSNIQVRAVFDTEETKSTGVLNRIIAEAQHPQADLFWSGDPMRPFQLISRGLVEPYSASGSAALPAYAKDAHGRWTGVSARVRVLLVNTTLVDKHAPSSIRDLADPRWKDRATMANPLFGTTTMHVAALFAAWGDEETRRFLEAVRENGVRLAASNGEVKRLVSSGEAAWGLTDTDDANDALQSGAPVRVIFPDQDQLGALVMPTSVVLIRGGAHPKEARTLIDHLASAEVERYLAQHGAHLPLQSGVAPPEGLSPPTEFRAMNVDYGQLAATIERIQPWLREWAGL
jgi:iron(III) transport system substrate-binding protein